MKRLFYLVTLLTLLTNSLLAQIKISGKVIDAYEKPVKGASVYLFNTIDGATTDSTGRFSFTTTETGNQNLVVTEVGHKDMGMLIFLSHDTDGIILRMQQNQIYNLDVVTITAGSFEAGGDRSKTILKPLDIVTTAGSNGDVVKALQTLPGTQQAGTENGLFVRGGDASEAAIIVDGTVAQSAFINGPPGVATRTRFGPFQFQGIAFSSGGYSARYGQALSAVLELNSLDIADRSTVNLGINMAGLYGSATKKWTNSSLDAGGGYNNLTPFYKLATTNFNFYDPPVGASGYARYVWKPNKDGIFKAAVNTNYTHSGIGVPNPTAGDSISFGYRMPDTIKFVTTDHYYFADASYKQMFKNKYSLFAAAAFTLDQLDNVISDHFKTGTTEYRGQLRVEGKYFIKTRLSWTAGIELQQYGTKRTGYRQNSYDETLGAGYTELEWLPTSRFALKPGVRYEHSQLLNKDNIAPRLAMAYKTGVYSQVSVASGIFYQNAQPMYLVAGLRPGFEESIHFIANWQLVKDNRTFRIEAYNKNYNDLVRETSGYYNNNRSRIIDSNYIKVNNSGYGYARGLEFFFRDKKSVKNADYWITYSYIDSRRLYQNFINLATPTFIATHNASFVGKYFIDKWQTNISATYSFASGYPYFNPETTQNNFLKDRTPDFHNVAISVAYLHTFGKWFTVFYAQVDNVLNTHNVFGYRYRYDAAYNVVPGSRSPIVPALYRTIFVGVNASLTKFSKDEL